MKKPSKKEVQNAIEVLRWMQEEVLSGSFYGWGIRQNEFEVAEYHLFNLVSGVYGERLKEEEE